MHLISLRWNHELDANIQPLEMVIVTMKTTMQTAAMMKGIVMKKLENVPNANVLTMSAPNVNVLIQAINDVKTFVLLKESNNVIMSDY